MTELDDDLIDDIRRCLAAAAIIDRLTEDDRRIAQRTLSRLAAAVHESEAA